MRRLITFIKNNRIIYKLSIVSFLIIMLISVVQINPKENNNLYKEIKPVSGKGNNGNNGNNSGNTGDPSEGETIADYYYVYKASTSNLYKVPSQGQKTEIDISTITGLSVENKLVTVDGETSRYNVLVLDGFNFKTSCEYALFCSEDTVIEVREGSTNTIEQQFVGNFQRSDGTVVYAANNLIMMGSGSLKIIANNTIDTYTKGLYVNGIANFIGVNITLNVIGDSYIHAIQVGDNRATSSSNIALKIQNNSNIDATVESKVGVDSNPYMQYIKYINGIACNQGMNIRDSNITVGLTSPNIGAGLFGGTFNKNEITNSKIDIKIMNTSKIGAGIYQSGNDGGGTYITSSDIEIYSAAPTSYGVKTDATISVTSSNVIINCMTGSLESVNASKISVTNCNLIEAKTTSGGALVSSPNINSISSYVYIKLVKPGTVLENNYALVYDSNNGTLHKVTNINEALTDTNKINTTTLSGWEIKKETNAITNEEVNVLVLNGLNFKTKMPTALKVVNGDAFIQVLGENTLENVNCTSEANTIYSAKNVSIYGSGTLNIVNKNNSITCRGIYVGNNDSQATLMIKDIYLNIDVQGNGINGKALAGIDTKILNLNNANVTINSIISATGTPTNGAVGISTSGDISIVGGTTSVTADNGGVVSGDGICSEGNIRISASANVIATTNGNNDSSGIKVVGSISINDSIVTAKNSSTEKENPGYGLYSDSIFEVVNSTVTAQGKPGAISLYGSYDIKGKVEASSNYDGTGKSVILSNEINSTYQYVLITPNKIISVDITWGAMDYTYEQTGWNPLTHSYATEDWKANGAEGSDKITVDNSNSNCQVKATITYTPVTEYNGIKGTILTDKINNTELTSPTVLQPGSVAGNSMVAYLKLNNKPSTVLTTTTIGNVTITIEE